MLDSFLKSIIACSLILILLLPVIIGINTAIEYSQIIYNIGVGFGALLGGFAGLRIIIDYLEKRKIEDIIEEYKKQYPIKNFKITFDLIRNTNNPNLIYVRELQTDGLIRHIGNRYTLRDLGFYGFEVKDINNEEFNKYTQGDRILTRREVGE